MFLIYNCTTFVAFWITHNDVVRLFYARLCKTMTIKNGITPQFHVRQFVKVGQCIEWTNLGTPQRICTSSLNLLQSIKITSSQSFSSFSTGHLKSLLVHVLYINLFNLQLYLICCILDHPLPQVKLQPHPICICPETKPDDNRNHVQRMKCN